MRARRYSHRVSLPMLLAAWSLIAIFAIGCSTKRPEGLPEADFRTVQMLNVGILLATSLGIILFIVVLFRVTKSYVVLGVMMGLILSAFIILKVPMNLQYAILGGILGVGSNFLSSLSKEGGAATVVERLAKFGARLVAAASNISDQLEIEAKQFQIARMIWACIFVIAFTLLCGNILEGLALEAMPWK